MANSPWPGIVIMVVLVVGLIGWCWWAVRKGKEQDKDKP